MFFFRDRGVELLGKKGVFVYVTILVFVFIYNGLRGFVRIILMIIVRCVVIFTCIVLIEIGKVY